MKSFSLLWLAAAYLLSMATARITFAEDTLSFVQACDSMAADIEDSQGGTKGLWDYQVKAKEAVDTCGKAVSLSSEPRLRYQFGRALQLSGSLSGALRQLELAGKQKYAWALSRLADIAESTKADIGLDAVQLNQRAAELNDPSAQLDLAIRNLGSSDDDTLSRASRQSIEELARKGFARAMIIEARLSELNGTQSGKETAGRLYHAAAEKGYLPAIKIVAFEMTDLGPGAAGFDTGLVWLRRASDAGDRESQLRLAEYCVYVSSVSCEK